MTVASKRCSKRKEIKLVAEFYKNAQRPDGFRHHCKTCVRGYRNLDAERKSSTSYCERYPVRALLRAAKCRAKKKGMEFDLKECDVTIPDTCPVFGMPLVTQRGTGACTRSGNSPTLDRIDNDKGYVRGNVIVVSWKANCLKRNFTPAEIRAVADFYESLLSSKGAVAQV